MSLIQRIGSSTEAYLLELTIHSVTINIPYPAKLKVVVERGKKYREETPAVENDVVLGTTFLEHTVLIPVTMFRKNRSYLKKFASFQLLQIVKNKSVKNGSVKLDLSKIFTYSTDFEKENIRLKHCSDKNAIICISAAMTRVDRTSSLGSLSTDSISSEEAEVIDLITISFDSEISRISEILPEKNNSLNSVTSEENQSKEKLETKEKFKERLEKLVITEKSQTSREPNTAYPYREVDSPLSVGTISPQLRRTEFLFSNSSIESDPRLLSPSEFNDFQDIMILDKEKPEPKPFVIKPVKIGCDDEKSNYTNNNKLEQEMDSVSEYENIESLPETSIKKARPNAHSKENELKVRERVGGLSNTNSSCSSCKGCMIF
ncbi:unnamed protein product [Blepharisma stoltei]|uniref:C2 NT-type domain-containing protein n=1 Tax=Blepharisma stoltei TaxID=1481888 RepID=A0AAU9J0C5_9CILI|nr:unnamed protein product [Blepharisma stoltei]